MPNFPPLYFYDTLVTSRFIFYAEKKSGVATMYGLTIRPWRTWCFAGVHIVHSLCRHYARDPMGEMNGKGHRLSKRSFSRGRNGYERMPTRTEKDSWRCMRSLDVYAVGCWSCTVVRRIGYCATWKFKSNTDRSNFEELGKPKSLLHS